MPAIMAHYEDEYLELANNLAHKLDNLNKSGMNNEGRRLMTLSL